MLKKVLFSGALRVIAGASNEIVNDFIIVWILFNESFAKKLRLCEPSLALKVVFWQFISVVLILLSILNQHEEIPIPESEYV